MAGRELVIGHESHMAIVASLQEIALENHMELHHRPQGALGHTGPVLVA